MPMYVYKCKNCKEVFDEFHFSSKEYTPCPLCGKRARRTFQGQKFGYHFNQNDGSHLNRPS